MTSNSRYQAISPELHEILERKIGVESELRKIERQIYDLEGSYLEDTSNYGNVLRGWDGYLNPKPKHTGGNMKRQRFKETDRLFSVSSVTSPKSIELQQEFGGFVPTNSPVVDIKREKKKKKQKKNNYGSYSSEEEIDVFY